MNERTETISPKHYTYRLLQPFTESDVAEVIASDDEVTVITIKNAFFVLCENGQDYGIVISSDDLLTVSVDYSVITKRFLALSEEEQRKKRVNLTPQVAEFYKNTKFNNSGYISTSDEAYYRKEYIKKRFSSGKNRNERYNNRKPITQKIIEENLEREKVTGASYGFHIFMAILFGVLGIFSMFFGFIAIILGLILLCVAVYNIIEIIKLPQKKKLEANPPCVIERPCEKMTWESTDSGNSYYLWFKVQNKTQKVEVDITAYYNTYIGEPFYLITRDKSDLIYGYAYRKSNWKYPQ